MPDADLATVLARLTAGELTLDEANALLFVTPLDPGLTCATCIYLRGAECWQPGQPAQAMHPNSVRCTKYDRRDVRAEALPAEPQRRRPLFK
jgi:hypothetical protein